MFEWDTGKKTTPFGPTLTPLPPSGLVDFTNPAHAWWRDSHRALGRSGLTPSEDFDGEQVPADALAHNGDTGAAFTTSTHTPTTVASTRRRVEAHGDEACVWGRAGWIGSQRVIRCNGVVIRRVIGKGWPPACVPA